MQALCPPCNLKKGSTMDYVGEILADVRSHGMFLRTHQIEALSKVDQNVNEGLQRRKTTAYVLPGGGKTLMGILVARLLLARGVIKQVLWLAPRRNLVAQVASAWCPPWTPHLLDVRTMNRLGAEPINWDRGSIGYCCSYGLVARNATASYENTIHLDFVKSAPTLVIPDEYHHTRGEYGGFDDNDRAVIDPTGPWATYMHELLSAAAYALPFSGSIFRHDGRPIPWFDYERSIDQEGREVLIPKVDVVYKRRAAIAEKAIRRINFANHDGEVKFLLDGEEVTQRISDPDSPHVRRAIQTFLYKGDYAHQIIDAGVQHLLNYRRKYGYSFRLILVASTIERVRAASKYIRDTYPELAVVDAVSDEPKCVDVIKRFVGERRKDGTMVREGDVLCTCAMAYEGLDVPSVTHMVILTNVRSVSFLEQVFGRGQRIDHESPLKPSQQYCFAFGPNDCLYTSVVGQIQTDQDSVIVVEEDDGPDGPTGPGPGRVPGPERFHGVDAEVDAVQYADDEQTVPQDESDRIHSTYERHPGLRHVPESVFYSAMKHYESTNPRPKPTNGGTDQRPIDKQIKGLRDQIEDLCRVRDALLFDVTNPKNKGRTNKELFKIFNKSRTEMTLTELELVYQYILAMQANRWDHVAGWQPSR
jgi:superfamily II DNA or RNA helicase